MRTDSPWFRGTLAPLNRVFGCGGIVAYHDVTQASLSPALHISAGALAEQLEFLTAERYAIISLRELIYRRRTGRSVRRCVALTFDDAYHGVLALALPLLERFAAPATVFVATAYAREGGGRYWWDRVPWVLERADRELAERLRGAGLWSPGRSAEEVRAAVILSGAGRLSDAADAAITSVERVAGVVPQRSLSEAELGQLARSELIDFGCHTDSHPALPALPRDEQRREIATSHIWLVERFPRVRRLVAYPYGLYDRTTVAAAREAGMEGAFSIEGRAAGPSFDLYTCPRIGMAEINTLRRLEVGLSWLAIPLLAWRNGGWHPRMPRAPGQVGWAAR